MRGLHVAHFSGRSLPPSVNFDDIEQDADDVESLSISVEGASDDAMPLIVPDFEMFSPIGTKLLPLWDRWPASELAKVRDRGLRAFQRSHGQRPISDDEAVFTTDVVKGCVDKSYILGTLPNIPKARWYITAGIDPAGSGMTGAYWVLAVLAHDRTTRHSYLIWVQRIRGGEVEDHKAVIRHVYAQHRWAMCNLERNNTQSLLLPLYSDHGRVPMKLIATTQTKHFEHGVLADQMASGWIHIPASPRTEPLLDELRQYPAGKFSDCVEALRLAWLLTLDAPKPMPGIARIRY